MADCPSVCEHLHLPVQSGDDAVLRRMGRQYTIEHYLERLARIRASVPGIAISSDVIVGFCGETEAQFQATLRLLEAVGYDQVFAAAYSVRPGTPAAHLADDVPPADQAAPAQRAAGRPGGDRLRAQPGPGRLDRRGSGRDDRPAARPRPRGGDGARATATGRTTRDGPPDRAEPRPHPRPPRRLGGPRRPARRRSDRPCRAVLAAWSARLTDRADRPPLLVLGGPTATGKTGLAVRLALALAEAGRPVEILSADSRQVYRGMDVGTAKPTTAERQGVAHHLLDLVEPDEGFSVADFVRAADPVLGDLRGRGRAALLVGGTGLWLRALATGLDVDASPADPELRARLDAELANAGLAGSRRGWPPWPPKPPPGPTCTTRAGSSGPWRSPRSAGTGRRLARSATAARCCASTWPSSRSSIGPGSSAGRSASSTADCPQRRPGCAPDIAPDLRSFSAIGYQEAFDLLDGRLDRTGFLAVNVARNVAFARRQRTWFRADAFGDVQLELDAAADPFQAAFEASRRFLAGEPVS